MKNTLPYGRQWIDDDDIAAVTLQLQSPWLTQGPKVAEFEQALAQATGARHAVVVSSGTAALHIAALAAGMGRGKTGLTSAITFVASANCIAYAGGRPAFVDVDPSTALMDVADLEKRCDQLARDGSAPAVILPVDFAGQPAPLIAVRDIARRYGARVIEDAAHALGAAYASGGEPARCGCCRDTDLAILSFHPVKHITTGEGGAVLTNDPTVHRQLMDLRSHGITKDPARLMRQDGPWYHEQHDLGFNYRLTDIQCALGLSQMAKLDRFVKRRRELAARYDAAFSNPPLAGLVGPLVTAPGAEHAYHLYVARIVQRDGESLGAVTVRRASLYEHLIAEGIHPQIHYIPVPRQPWYREHCNTRPEDFPGAESYYAGCLSLPMFPKMEDEDVDRVIEAICAWIRKE